MPFETYKFKQESESPSAQRVKQILDEHSYKSPWYATVGRSVGRIPFRALDSTVQTVSDLTGGKLVDAIDYTPSERDIFGDPQGGGENLTAELGSWIVGFAGAGTGALKGVQAVGKFSTRAKKVEKLKKRFGDAIGNLEKSKVGDFSVRSAKVLADGAFRGGISDFLNADVSMEDEILDRLDKRFDEVVMGAIWGAGGNVALKGIGKVFGRGAKEARFTAQKKAVIESRKAVAEAFDGNKEIDGLDAMKVIGGLEEGKEATFDNLMAGAGDVTDLGKRDVKKVKEAEELLQQPEDTLEENLIENFLGNKELPEMIKDFNILFLHWEEEFAPALNDLYGTLRQIQDTPNTKDFKKLQEGIEGIEKQLITYKVLIKTRSKVGTMAGKALQALRLTSRDKLLKGQPITLDTNTGDFTKTVEFKGETAQKIEQIETLLETIGKARDVKTENLKSFIIDLDPDKKLLVDAVGDVGKSDLHIVRDVVRGLGKRGKDSVWNKYKVSILKALRKSTVESGNVKPPVAPLNVLSATIRKRLQKVLDGKQNVPPTEHDRLQKKIDELTDLEGNKDAIQAIINELGESGVKAQGLNVDALLGDDLDSLVNSLFKSGNTEELLRDLNIEDGLRRQIEESLENADKLLKTQLEEDELLRELDLQNQIDEITDLLKGGNEDAIKAFFDNAFTEPAKQSKLQKALANAKKNLKKELDRDVGLDEVASRILQDLQAMVARSDKTLTTKSEKFWMGWDRMRMNLMMFHPKTWLIGPVSGIFHLIEQPVKQAWESWRNIKKLKKLDPDGVPENLSNLRYAWAQIQTALDWGSLWDGVRNGMSTAVHNKSAFNPRLKNRFYQEFQNAGVDFDPTVLHGMTESQADEFSNILKLYGTDNKVTRHKLQAFYDQLDNAGEMGWFRKSLDIFGSISFRAMGATDDIFRTYGTMRALRAEAMQKALISGKTTKAEINAFMEDYIEKGARMETTTRQEFYGVGGDTVISVRRWNMDEEFSHIEQLGLSVTYQADYADRVFSRLMQGAATWSRDYKNDDPIKFLVRNLLIPFVKTPAAIAQWMLDNGTPLTGIYRRLTIGKKFGKLKEELIDGIQKARKAGDGDKVAEETKKLRNLDIQIAKTESEAEADIIMGTFWTATIGYFGATSKITGTGAHMTKDEKAMAEAEGWKPQTFMVGNTQVSYARMEPLASLIAVVADVSASIARQQSFKNSGACRRKTGQMH